MDDDEEKDYDDAVIMNKEAIISYFSLALL